jgi:hypothetical protein
MPKTTIIACKFRQKINEPLKINKHFKNGQAMYQILMNIQFERNADQI